MMLLANRIRPRAFAVLAAGAGLGLCCCGGTVDSDARLDGHFVNVFTGQTCRPDALTFVPADAGRGGGNTSPTGIPGDNMDDLRSGQVDCLGDGNSGQGDDFKHDFCGNPPPGCDDSGCCEEDCAEPPEDSVDEEPPPEEPPVEEPPTEEPPSEEPPYEEPSA
jgi:hypothetical protein